MNDRIIETIPKIYIHGEWCKNEGYNGGNYFVFRRSCGEAFFLDKNQLENYLKDLIWQF